MDIKANPTPLLTFFFATSGHSGVDRAMKNLLPSIARRGYEVELLKIRKHGPYLEEKHPNLKIIKLPTSHVYSSFFHLVRYLKKTSPYCILTDKDRVNRTMLLAKLISRVPSKIFLSSGTTISIDLATRGAFERWLQKNSMGKLYRFAHKTIVTSKGVAEDMSDYTGLPRKYIEVVPSPVIPENILYKRIDPPDHPWFKKKSSPIILGVGELCLRKDFFTLIKAFSLIRKETKAKLVILGRGRMRDELIGLARALGVKNDVDFPGFKHNPYPYMAHADVFAFSSRWEGLGFVIIEALAVGTPVVATDCPSGPREILQDGKYGPLVPVGNAQEMANAIMGILNNPPSPDFLKRAAMPYTIEASTTAYLKTFGLPPYREKNE